MTLGFYELTYFLTFDKQLLKFSVSSTPNFSLEGDISPYQSIINEIQSKATQSIEICLYKRERIKFAFNEPVYIGWENWTWKREVAGSIPCLANLIFCPKIGGGHCDRIHNSLTAVHYFEDGYVGKQ